MRLSPGDIIRGTLDSNSACVREIVEVRPNGYTWTHAGHPETLDLNNTWWSENSGDPLFEYGWVKVVKPNE